MVPYKAAFPQRQSPSFAPAAPLPARAPARSPYARLAGSGQADEPTDAANTTGRDIEAARRAVLDDLDRWLTLATK
jgi:hypothetical protein